MTAAGSMLGAPRARGLLVSACASTPDARAGPRARPVWSKPQLMRLVQNDKLDQETADTLFHCFAFQHLREACCIPEERALKALQSLGTLFKEDSGTLSTRLAFKDGAGLMFDFVELGGEGGEAARQGAPAEEQPEDPATA